MALIALGATMTACGQETIKLDEPDLERGKSIMASLSERKSVRAYTSDELSLRDLSDLLWAANGINRPDGHRTAPSAMDRRDIKIYIADARGAYYYNPEEHSLELISKGDFRQKIREEMPALNVLVVADDGEARLAEVNAGYVSQNIYLACSGLGMATVACGTMDAPAFAKACKLSAKQRIVVQHPVGYPRQ